MGDFSDWDVLIACGNKRDRYALFDYFDQKNCHQLRTAKDASRLPRDWAESGFNTLVIEVGTPWVNNLRELKSIKESLKPPQRLFALVGSGQLKDGATWQQVSEACDGLLFSPVNTQAVDFLLHSHAKSAEIQPREDAHSEDQSQAFWHLFFEDSAIPQVIVDAQSQRIIKVNEAFCQLAGCSDTACIGHSWHELDRTHSLVEYDRYHKDLNSQGHVSFQFKLATGDDHTRWVKAHYQITVLAGKPVYLGMLQDQDDVATFSRVMEYISQLQPFHVKAEKCQELYRQVVQWLGLDYLVVAHMDGETGDAEPDPCMSAEHWHSWQSDQHTYLMRQLRKGQAVEIENDAANLIPSDTWLNQTRARCVLAYPFCREDGGLTGFLVASASEPRQNSEISRFLLSEMAAHIAKSAHIGRLYRLYKQEGQHDPLTGLPNRLLFVQELDKSIDKASRENTHLAVIFVDLDKFKNINDSLGHDIGDEVLLTVTQLLKKSLGNRGLLARFAGDEFTILIDQVTSRDEVIKLVNEIRDKMSRPLLLSNGSELLMTLSIGISFFPDHGKTTATLLKNADLAMYDAKLGGRNRIKVYEEKEVSSEAGKQKLELESQLRQSIKRKQLLVFYQPKIDAASEKIVGFEALVRWKHLELGLISPGFFIPMAEESGFIREIGYWVLEQACKQCLEWQQVFNQPLTISVNLSPAQFVDSDLVQHLDGIVSATGLHPKFVDFEITESISLEKVPNLLNVLRELNELGYSLSIDDFGTGQSSLDYIKKIPAKYLKIDQTFVRNIGVSPDDEAILEATVNMAKRMGHELVAEGVETEAQREYLVDKGCQYFQGFLFCRPLPASEIHNILEAYQLLEQEASIS